MSLLHSDNEVLGLEIYRRIADLLADNPGMILDVAIEQAAKQMVEDIVVELQKEPR